MKPVDGTSKPRESCLEIADLSVTYGTAVALRDVNLAIPRGQITALIGPSGCGKTSFLSVLNRMTDLIPGCVVTGRVRFAGVDIHAPAVDVVALRRRIGLIFQKPNPFPLSIRRNVTLPLADHGLTGRAPLDAACEEALRAVGLWDEVADRLDHSALELSGGQQQRLCIARALALDPEMLLMDEPCSALDPIASATVEALIAELRGRLTIVIVTHNLGQARRLADRVGVFWVRDGAGRLIEEGPAERVFTTPVDPLTADYVRGRRG